MNFKIDYCTHKAAKYAVQHWHYSKCMPIGKVFKLGVWEDNIFIGVVLFSTGASPQIHKAFKIDRFNMCELVRVALDSHVSPVTKIVSIALKTLHKDNPGLRLCVSFADPEHKHLGVIYQAGNWIYTGRSTPGLYYKLKDGTVTHNRNIQGAVGFGGKPTIESQQSYSNHLRAGLKSGDIKKIITLPKYKYLYPLDKAMRRQIIKLAKPYPKELSGQSVDGNTAGFQLADVGSTPADRSMRI